jgi:hypothetical protein
MLNPLQENYTTETNSRPNPRIHNETAHVNTPSTPTGEGKVGFNAGDLLMPAWLQRLWFQLANT